MGNKKKTKHRHTFKISLDMTDIKIRKRHAPGVRVIKSEKDKEAKHKIDWRQEDERNDQD